MESLLNKKVDDTVNKLSGYELNIIKIGNGNKIVSQYPSVGTNLVSGDKVILITNDKNYVLPNFYGWSRYETEYFLKHFNIDYELEGYGYVNNQSIGEGTPIPMDNKITLTLSDKFEIKSE